MAEFAFRASADSGILWALAAELASQHGVLRTAQVLRLDYTKLKHRTREAAPAGKPASVPPQRRTWLV
jgi:hypothetical protein